MMEKLIKKLNNRKGFTLIELIVVIAIIGILAAILIPQFTGFTNKAESTQAVVEAKQIATAIDAIRAETGDYTTDEGDIFDLAFGGTAPSGSGWTATGDPDDDGGFEWQVEGGFKAGRTSSGAVESR